MNDASSQESSLFLKVGQDKILKFTLS